MMAKNVLLAGVCLLLVAGLAKADVFNMGSGLVSLEMVPVGNPGNTGEGSGVGYGGVHGEGAICGSVAYIFSIGRYEVTAGQYCEFLNKVAATDTYDLYSSYMASDTHGCRIQRTGPTGNFSYSVAIDWANRPVNFVSWGDAARFANWLHNGQPSGIQDQTTTEAGAYTLNGAVSRSDIVGVTRETNWKWAIPSEDEWYKAAYHKNDGVTGNYFDFPTGSDDTPTNTLGNPDPGNNATFYDNEWTIGSPYYRTEVGAHEHSKSPYGTYDQGGNVWEWNEAFIRWENTDCRGLRGGSFDYMGNWGEGYLHACDRNMFNPLNETQYTGFRVVSVEHELVCPSADLTGDCFVDLCDLSAFASQWLTGHH